jgi:hypothetical protein
MNYFDLQPARHVLKKLSHAMSQEFQWQFYSNPICSYDSGEFILHKYILLCHME